MSVQKRAFSAGLLSPLQPTSFTTGGARAPAAVRVRCGRPPGAAPGVPWGAHPRGCNEPGAPARGGRLGGLVGGWLPCCWVTPSPGSAAVLLHRHGATTFMARRLFTVLLWLVHGTHVHSSHSPPCAARTSTHSAGDGAADSRVPVCGCEPRGAAPGAGGPIHGPRAPRLPPAAGDPAGWLLSSLG